MEELLRTCSRLVRSELKSETSLFVFHRLPAMVKSKVCPATSRARLTEQTRPSRFRFHHLFAILALSSLSLFLYTHRAPPTPPATPLSFCPPSTSRKHIPTVVLHTDGSSARTENRTYWVQHDRASSPFLPFSYPPRDLRFAQRAAAGEGQGPNGQGNLRAVAAEVVEEPTRLCPVYAVAGSRPPVVPTDWNNHKLMFGMSTSPDRVLSSLPVWSHWLPSSSSPLDPNSANADLPLVLILTPPPNPTEALRMREAVEEAQSLGMHVQMRAAEASRFETRYFTLVREMWVEALKRETTHGIITEWFIFACVLSPRQSDDSRVSATTTLSSLTLTRSFVCSRRTTRRRQCCSVR